VVETTKVVARRPGGFLEAGHDHGGDGGACPPGLRRFSRWGGAAHQPPGAPAPGGHHPGGGGGAGRGSTLGPLFVGFSGRGSPCWPGASVHQPTQAHRCGRAGKPGTPSVFIFSRGESPPRGSESGPRGCPVAAHAGDDRGRPIVPFLTKPTAEGGRLGRTPPFVWPTADQRGQSRGVSTARPGQGPTKNQRRSPSLRPIKNRRTGTVPGLGTGAESPLRQGPAPSRSRKPQRGPVGLSPFCGPTEGGRAPAGRDGAVVVEGGPSGSKGTGASVGRRGQVSAEK